MANVVQTSRLALIPLTKDHVEAFHAVWSDPGATSWSLHGHNETLAASEEWMARILRTPETDNYRAWAVYEAGNLDPKQCIGIVTLRPKERSGGDGTWELGYLYRPKFWGKGYATESCAAAIESLKKDLNAKALPYRPKLIAWICPDNKGSCKVVEKLGFRWTELKMFGEAPNAKLGGEWREDGVSVYEREL